MFDALITLRRSNSILLFIHNYFGFLLVETTSEGLLSKMSKKFKNRTRAENTIPSISTPILGKLIKRPYLHMYVNFPRHSIMKYYVVSSTDI